MPRRSHNDNSDVAPAKQDAELDQALRMEHAQVEADGRLVDAMWALDRSALECALVIEQGRLVGILTDGDIRRALLRGASLRTTLSPFITRRFTSVAPGASRAEVVELMQARRISQIPIVDELGRLTGLHLLHEVIGARIRPNWAVVMAGGKGTRLRPLTEHVPKPMIQVAGRPILERLLLHLVSHGIRRVFLAINYLGHIVEEHFGDGSQFGCQIDYLREQKPLDTAGALSLLPEAATESILVMNGDLVTQADLGAMVDHHAHESHAITVGLKKYFHKVPYGCVRMDAQRIIELEEKPTLMRQVNAGIYIIRPDVLAGVAQGEPLPMPGLVERTIRAGQHVGGFAIEEDWIDVGQRDQLQQAQQGQDQPEEPVALREAS